MSASTWELNYVNVLFFVGNLYQGSPHDVSDMKSFSVRGYLERYCDKKTDQKLKVWEAIGSAIQNAVTVATNWNLDHETNTSICHDFREIIKKLIAMCVRTR